MCVVDRKTYIHPDGRRELVETPRLCHNAVGNRLCAFVETRNAASVRVAERKPTRSSTYDRRPSSSSDFVTVTPGGREQRYTRLGRRPSTRDSSGRTSKISTTSSPVDSAAGSSSPVPAPVYQERRPSAMAEPPLMSGGLSGLPSARRPGPVAPSSPTSPPNPFTPIGDAGDLVYDRPPSLPRATANDRPSTARGSSFSSITAEVDDPEIVLPRRGPSIRERRQSKVAFEPVASGSKHRSSGEKGKSRARVDSLRDDAEASRRKQRDEEDERQARLERDRLAASYQRQEVRRSRETAQLEEEQARIERVRLEDSERRRRMNAAREAEEEARRRAEDLRRERDDASRERKERHRREAAAALEGQRQADLDDVYRRRVDAELNQYARERADRELRDKRESAERYQEMRSTESYTTSPSSPISARTYTPMTSTRQNVTLHHYPSTRRESALLDRGERVIAREQGRAMATSRRLDQAMGGLELEDVVADEEMDAAIDEGIERSASRRSRREDRERRRRRPGYY